MSASIAPARRGAGATRGIRRLTAVGDDRFKTLMAVLIAGVSALTALVGLLQYDAATLSDRAKRTSQHLALQAAGLRVGGEAQVGFDWYEVYYQWSELDLRVRLAAAEGEPEVADRYAAARDRLRQASPFLQPPYFDPASGERPDLDRRRSDTYAVQATILSERSEAIAAQADVLDSKERSYITITSLLAITLALYGLAATMGAQVRWIFAATGSIALAGTLFWIGTVLAQPEPARPDAAIEAYARGTERTARKDWSGAIEAFDEAIRLEPDYANAYYEKAGAQDSLGDYAGAAASAQQAWDAGKQIHYTAWNLGWWSYLLARYDEAVIWDDRALELNENLFEVRGNKGLALMAAGRVDEAGATYREMIDRAARRIADARAAGQEPPSSLWVALEHAGEDLQNLLDRWEGRDRPWTMAPPREAIRGMEAARASTSALIRELKQAGVALEYTGRLPGPRPDARFESLSFVTPGGAAPAGDRPTFPAGTTTVVAQLPFAGALDGHDLVVLVYRDGAEDQVLRIVRRWDHGSAGEARLPVRSPYGLPPGEYAVEVYVDAHLAAEAEFQILKPSP